MIEYFKKVLQIKTTAVLFIISLFSITLSITRALYTGRSIFLFMLWNLFLAFIPWFAASVVYLKSVKNKIIILLLIFCWLAFFPNAPYLLTDIMHLGKGHPTPIWFDFILLLSYGFTGLLFGFTSLYMIEKNISFYFKKLSWIFSVILIYLSCFGVYLGRFLRWNSWDLITNLNAVLKDIYIRMINPTEHPTTWIFTILLGTLLNILFWSYKIFNDNQINIKGELEY